MNNITALLPAATLAATVSAMPAQAATVRLTQGELLGTDDGSVQSYKGIPFAAPPVGALLWRPPAPPASWAGPRDATRFGPACVQPNFFEAKEHGHQSEDCLTLNVWKPATAKAGERLPVMVWIYGGGFRLGGSSLPVYDGKKFAEQSVVLVSINYRLGRFGSFAHPALTAESPTGPLGNYGLMDAIAALDWVRSNVAAFGGDPANVTIFGQSAGGMMVNMLMAAPPARGLFSKAISMAGFPRYEYSPIRGDAAETGEKHGLAFAAEHGIRGADAAAARALRDVPASAVNDIPATSPTLTFPVVDGVVLPASPVEAFRSGQAASVPYIVGGTSWEASVLAVLGVQPDPLFDPYVAAPARRGEGYRGAAAKVRADLKTDLMMTEPLRYVARAHAHAGHPTWAYRFDYLPRSLRGSVPGAGHAWEVAYAFDTLSPNRRTQFYDIDQPPAGAADLAMARTFQRYLVSFAKTGNPNVSGLPRWPGISENDTFMVFGPAGARAQARFRQTQLDAAAKAPAAFRLPR